MGDPKNPFDAPVTAGSAPESREITVWRSAASAAFLPIEAPERADDLLTKRELAKLLRISERTLDRRKSAGELPRCVRIGGRDRWRRNTVLQWLQQQEERR